MSYWSTLKSIFRTPKPQGTPVIISVASRDGSEGFDCQIYLPAHVVNMLQLDPARLQGEIWKHYGQPSDTTLGSTVRWPVCRLSFSPANPRPVHGGYRALKRGDYEWLR